MFFSHKLNISSECSCSERFLWIVLVKLVYSCNGRHYCLKGSGIMNSSSIFQLSSSNLPSLQVQKKREESFSTSFLSSFLEKPYLLLFAWHRQRRWEIEGRENKIETIALLDNILQTILICTQKKKPQTPIWKSSLTVSFLCNVKFYHLRDSCQKRR